MTTFDWNRFLALAIELQKVPDEASLRTAISRAYYFVYNVARNRPAVSQYRFDLKAPAHEQLWALYTRNSGDCKVLADIAVRLKMRRVKADYQNFSYPRAADDLVGVLIDAQKCASILSALDEDYPKPVPKSYSIGG
jgi:hypothetical protein